MNRSQLPYGLVHRVCWLSTLVSITESCSRIWIMCHSLQLPPHVLALCSWWKFYDLSKAGIFVCSTFQGRKWAAPEWWRKLCKPTQLSLAVLGFEPHSACVPLCRVSSLRPLVMEHLLGQFPTWAFYWEVQNSQCRLNTKWWYCFHDSVSVTFQKAHPLS